MAGAMRKMAVYLGLVEDDGYDGRGSTPMTSSSPSLTRSPTGAASTAPSAGRNSPRKGGTRPCRDTSGAT